MTTRTPIQLRYYIKTDDDGLRRLPKYFFDGKRPLTDLAGRRIAIVEVFFDTEGLEVRRASGRYIRLDADGNRETLQGQRDMHAHSAAVSGEARAKRCRPVDLAWVRKARSKRSDYEWTPSSDELDAIWADMLPAGHRSRVSIRLYNVGAARRVG